MPTITTQAGPWNMTVYAFAEDDPENPLQRVSADEVARLPYGAAELDRDGKVVAYNDTEPDDFGPPRPSLVGRDFFGEVARWAGNSLLERQFRNGVASGDLNVVFDCAVARLPHKVRVHLKVSPILGTFWVFIKKLARKGQ
jgi:photoactive yellow protein